MILCTFLALCLFQMHLGSDMLSPELPDDEDETITLLSLRMSIKKFMV